MSVSKLLQQTMITATLLLLRASPPNPHLRAASFCRKCCFTCWRILRLAAALTASRRMGLPSSEEGLMKVLLWQSGFTALHFAFDAIYCLTSYCIQCIFKNKAFEGSLTKQLNYQLNSLFLCSSAPFCSEDRETDCLWQEHKKQESLSSMKQPQVPDLKNKHLCRLSNYNDWWLIAKRSMDESSTH